MSMQTQYAFCWMKNALPTHALQMRYHLKVGVKIPRYSCREIITQIGIIVRKYLVICATQLIGGELLKMLKYFEVVLNIFFNFSACKKLNGSPNDITEVSASFLGLLKKQSTLRLPLFSIFFSRNVLEYWSNQSKKYFRDYTIQLFVAIKGKFLDYSFSAHIAEKMNSPKIS